MRQRRPVCGGRSHAPLDSEQQRRAEQRPFKRDIVIRWPHLSPIGLIYVREECETEGGVGGSKFSSLTPIERWSPDEGKAPRIMVRCPLSFDKFMTEPSPSITKLVPPPAPPAQDKWFRLVRHEDGTMSFKSVPPPPPPPLPVAATAPSKKRKRNEAEAEPEPEEVATPPMTRSRQRLLLAQSQPKSRAMVGGGL